MTHALREAIAAVRRAPVLTGLSAAMVGLALFVVTLFALAAFNLRVALQTVEERVEVIAYLRDGARPEETEIARRALRELPEVEAVEYVSKDDALARARRDLPEFGEVFGDGTVNPLPASLEVRLRDGLRSGETVERVAGVARDYPFVEDVTYGREWVDRLFTLRRMAAVSSAVLGGAFAAVAALIIGAALRIAIFARRDEIYVMRLVGARNGFIQRPFLVEGAMAGMVGGVLALAATWGAHRLIQALLYPDVAWIPSLWAVFVVVAGGAFGVLSSAVAVHRHLREV